jgi:hypothetical protein
MRLHLHWYKIVHDTGGHLYGECRCGQRKVYLVGGGMQPVDQAWLEGGEWNVKPPIPLHRPTDLPARPGRRMLP